jgi:N-acetylglucosamine kinase-like BadF-type ATPase
MSHYYLGVDVGSSKTHALVVDAAGRVLGFGRGGGGNHEGVGFEGFMSSVRTAINESLANAGVKISQLNGAGFGISGYDWPSERPVFLDLLKKLGMTCPYDIVNDSCLGLLAGSTHGWGVAVVSGTGCNCWGWTEGRKRIGQVTGAGDWMGEGAGASELISKALVQVAYQWTKRGPATSLSDAFIRLTGATGLEDLLEGIINGRYELDNNAAPLVFECAVAGDEVANQVITWAGNELGELAKCVIRQLDLQDQPVEVVMIGSLYDGGERLIEPMRQNILQLAPRARLVRPAGPPVIGAAILAMEAAGLTPDDLIKQELVQSVSGWV